MPAAPRFQPYLRKDDHLCAAAAMGDADAIQALAATTDGVKTASNHRLGPLLATRAHLQKLPLQPEWHASLRGAAISRILLEQARQDLGKAFDDLSIPWLPLKGMGSIIDSYPRPECRPTSDLDVLIPREQLEISRNALGEAGWTPIDDEDFDPNTVYNWKARHQSGIMLELHYTLWGGVDSRLAETLLQNAEKAPGLGSSALRSPAPDLYVTGATHLWNSPRPRVLLYFLDLHLLALIAAKDQSTAGPNPDLAASVIQSALNHDLQLFVGLAAAITNHFWPHHVNATIAEVLLQDLRLSEKSFLRLSGNTPSTDLHLGAMTLARLLSRRKTRSGWNAASRYLRRTSLSRED